MADSSKWLDNLRIGKEHDSRRKYTEDDRRRILSLQKEGFSQREIAREIGCSRRYVQFTLNPEREERVKKRAKEVKRWEPYNRSNYRKETMRKHRSRLRKIHNID